MPLDTIRKLPGVKDINDQFTKANIHKTLAFFRKIERNGSYAFGGLTAAFYNLSGNSGWMNEVKLYPVDAQDKIKNCIIQALTHKDASGKDDPIPLVLNWVAGESGVTCTYDPSGPSYTIDIGGLPPPMTAALSDRTEK
jgi:hypothetical protein